jgi:single-stranded-DNA-specific exonuclease
MGDAIDAFRLFTTSDENVADALAKKLEKANRSRKAEAGAITRAAHEKLRERETVPSVIVLGDPEWRPALLGLVANTIADEYERPVFLWGREGNMTLKGSVRSGGATHILELMRAAEEGTFIEFGGHRAAGGFSVSESEIFELEARLVEAHAKMDALADADETLADAHIAIDSITNTLFTTLERLAPFGMDNPKPRFVLHGVVVNSVSRFGKNNEHVKLALARNDSREPLGAVAFFAKGAIARAADTFVPNTRAHVVAHLERDTFSRGTPIRLRLLDIKSA